MEGSVLEKVIGNLCFSLMNGYSGSIARDQTVKWICFCERGVVHSHD